VRVGEDSPLEGKTIKEAELRDLKSAYLAHIRRDDRLIPSSPESILQVGDILAFQGNASLIDELNEKYGLSRVGPELEESQGSTMPLFEAVIAPTSFLVGRTLRDAQFRERYNGVVLGIQRREMPLRGPLGRVALQTGDLLLIEAPKGFDRQWNEKRDEFYLVAPRKTKAPKEQSGKGPIAITILGLVILAATLGWAPISVTAFIGALALLGLHLMTPKEAGDSVDISVLTVIAAALGIGEAISASGLADLIGNMLAQWAGVLGPIGAIAILYLATNLLTELITNNAAAALMVPVGLSVAEQMTINPVAIAITIAVAASASFMTPIGYQTNMMVMAAGAYHFNDFFRIGFRVNLIVGTLTIAIVAWKWL
jgi:di/tricarboxylate transporter